MSQCALGGGEISSFLRQIYPKVLARFPAISKEYALSLSMKSMNEIAVQNGLCPPLLVFGVLTRMSLTMMDLPRQRERMPALKLARLETSNQVHKASVVVYTLQALRPVHSFRSQCIVPDTVRLP